jgi:N-acetylmuramic acid 6-phosphate etherase
MANDYMLDIFTDTTERAPTFMLPPLRRSDDARAPRPWSVVKHLFLSTPRAWEDVFQRAPRCLDWNPVTYQELGASERIQRLPPAIRFSDLLQFAVGAEDDPSRHATADDVATLLLVGPETFADASEEARLMEAFRRLSEGFPHRSALLVGSGRLHAEGVEETFRVPVDLAVSPLMLWDHLAVKLVLNTVSTVTMARMGRLVSNWMAHVETTNKKLIDRGTRLVACLTGMSYEDACVALHQTIAELADWPPERGEKPSPVALTVQRFRNSRKA